MADPTENTVNDLFAQFLRAEGDLNILREFSARIPAGRRGPDFRLVHQTGVFYGEGEWQDRFSDGYDQAIEFGDIADASGYFLIGYDRKLAVQTKQKRIASPELKHMLKGVYWGRFKRTDRPMSRFHGSLEDLCQWINANLTGRPHEEKPEAFLSFVPSLIEALVEIIPGDVADRLGYEPFMSLMGGKDKFIPPEVVRDAAAYILLDQIVFYRILAGSGREFEKDGTKIRLELVDPKSIRKPTDIQPYFDSVLRINYQPIFKIDVLSTLDEHAVQVLRRVFRLVNEDQPEALSGEILGNMWHMLIPRNLRKPVAAFYTNTMASRLLAKLTIRDADATVADFACGSGTLLVAAYERKCELLGRPMTEADHKRILRQITGADIMAFSAHLAVVQLAMRRPFYETDEVRVAVYDSTDFKPGKKVKPLQEVWPRDQTTIADFGLDTARQTKKLKKGSLSAKGDIGHEFTLEPVDVVLMNPPFTRQETIPNWLKGVLPNRFDSYGKYIRGQMGLGGYFVFLADRFLKPGGVLGFVLPSTVLKVRAYEGVRQMLLAEGYHIEYVVVTEARSAFSESTAFREMLLVARKAIRGECLGTTKFVNLKVLPRTEDEADKLAEAIRNARI